MIVPDPPTPRRAVRLACGEAHSLRPPHMATHLRFSEGGGYERREWWSDEGWSWKEQYDISRTAGWGVPQAADRRPAPLQPSSLLLPIGGP